MKRLKKWNKESGFTLIELALVLFVISVLLLLVIPNIGNSQKNATKTGNEALSSVVNSQAVLYKMNKDSTGTITIDELVKEKYLTAEQGKQAKEANIIIGDQ